MIRALLERIENASGWFVLISGWERHFVAMGAGALSAFALAPFDVVPILFLTFPILVWLIDGAVSEPAGNPLSRLMHGFKPGFFFGFGYFLLSMWWIGNALLVEADSFAWALPLAVVALPAVLALFWGFATGLASLFWNGNIRRLFMLGACLALAEYLRGFVATGFPWNTLSYAAYPTPLLMQSASIFGIYAMTAIAVLVFSTGGAIVLGSAATQFASFRRMSTLAIVLVGAHALFGFWRIPPGDMAMVEGVSLRLVQPSVPQADKFSQEKHPDHFKRYLDLSTGPTEQKDGLSGTTHLFWPESVFPYLLTQRKDTLASIAAMLPEGTSLITGAARGEAASLGGGSDFVFNSAYVINDKGLIVSAADKVHLVPFGEYLPFQDILESVGIQQLTQLDGGFEAGASRKLLSTGIGPAFLPLICYEILFSGELWSSDKERPGFIVNPTNDAWYGYSPGPFQHERQSVLRAVEEGVPLVRVANNGISGVYDPYGRPVVRTELDQMIAVDASLPVTAPPTVFSRFGSTVFYAITAIFFLIGVFPTLRRKKNI